MGSEMCIRDRYNHGSSPFMQFGVAQSARLYMLHDGTISYRTGGGKGFEFNSSGSSASVAANMYAPASYTLAFATNGNERLRITSGGAVSVGNNASPDGKLHVYSSSAGTVTADGDADELVLESSGNTGMSILSPGTGESSIYFGNPGTNGQKDAWIKYYHETHSTTANRRALTFRTSGTERLRIDSTGLLGLNRTPVYSGLFGGSQKGMHIGGSTAPFLRITSDTSNQGDLVLHAGNSGADISMANLTAGGDIVFWNRPSGGSIAERLRITSGGQVGINQTDIDACLLYTSDAADE